MRSARFAADSRAAGAADTIRQALWDAGLDEDIYVEVIAGATQTGGRQSRYQRWFSADLPDPDMLLMDSGWALTFIQRGQLLNLEEELPQPFFDLSQPFKGALIVTFIFTVVSVFFETLIGFGQALVLDLKNKFVPGVRQDLRGRRELEAEREPEVEREEKERQLY